MEQQDPNLGKDVHHYRLVRLIARGGMGMVYEARHRTIGQRAAIKLLPPQVPPCKDLQDRFLIEAQAASMVQHPGVVRIFDYGHLPGGAAFIIMEHLEGESLHRRLSRLRAAGQTLPAGQVIRLGRQVALALCAVHARQIIHRDLKPGNILLCPDPECPPPGRAKVLDFGIAKLAARPPAPSPSSEPLVPETTVGRFLGTPTYASPEQCQMAGAVSDQSDVYSLGVILYEALAGAPPFAASSPGLLIGMHLLHPPPPLRAQAEHEGLCRLILDMLAKDPRSRPTMAEVEAALTRLGQEAPEEQTVQAPCLAVADAPLLIDPTGPAPLTPTGEQEHQLPGGQRLLLRHLQLSRGRPAAPRPLPLPQGPRLLPAPIQVSLCSASLMIELDPAAPAHGGRAGLYREGQDPGSRCESYLISPQGQGRFFIGHRRERLKEVRWQSAANLEPEKGLLLPELILELRAPGQAQIALLWIDDAPGGTFHAACVTVR